MNREQLMAEIGRLDEEINATLSATKMPSLKYTPFPRGMWIFAAALLAWSFYGDEIPTLGRVHLQTAMYAFYGAIVVALFALIGTLRWMFGRGRNSSSPEYTAAVAKVKTLQDQRTELQAELRMLGR